MVDPRLTELFTAQRARQFADLAGSETQSTIRVSEPLVNQAIAASLPPGGRVKDVRIQLHAGNRMDVTVTLTKPAFLPRLHLVVEIEHQPEIPASPILVLRLSGAGGLIRLAAPLIANIGVLPPWIRLDGDRVYLDLAALARQQGHEALLHYVQQLRIATEEAGLAVYVAARLP